MRVLFDGLETLDRNRWRVILILSICLFAGLRAVQLGSSEISLDEAFTWHYLRQPWSEVSRFVIAYDVYPPVYFLYTKIYFTLFGGEGWVLRLGGMVFEVLALPLIYFTAWMLAPAGRQRSVGIVALVLAGLSPAIISTALLARPYAGIYFFYTVCFAALSWIVTHAEISGRSVFTASGRRARIPYLALAIGIAAMPWLHNLGLLYSMSVGVISVLIWWFVLGRTMATFGNFAATAGLATLLYLPFFNILLRQLGDVNSSWWLEQPTIAELTRTILQVYGQAGNIGPAELAAIAVASMVIMAGLYGAATLMLRRRLSLFLLLVGLPGLVFLAFVLVTYLVKPVILNRAMHPMLGPWFVLLALSAVSLPRPRFQVAFAAVLVAAFAWSATTTEKDQPLIGPILAAIAGDAGQTPVILTLPNSAALMLEHQAIQAGVELDIIPLPGPYPALDDPYTYPTSAPGVPALHPIAMDEVASLLDNGDRDTWVFLRGYGIFDPDALLKPLIDQKFCYQPVDGIPLLFHFMKLVPRSELASGNCTDLGTGNTFPYYRPDYGYFQLEDM